MPEKVKTLAFPTAGVSKKYAYQQSAPFSCLSAKNIWLTEPSTGRERGATRAPITSTAVTIGAPYMAMEGSWQTSGTLRRGLIATTANGTYVIYNTGSWSATEWITTNPGTTFASSAIYLNTLYQAAGGAEGRAQSLATAAGLGDTLISIDTAGTAPSNCGIVATHGDRIYWAGDTGNPWSVYSPRIGTPTDWLYSDVDESAAVTFRVNEPVTSFISHTFSCAIIGQTDSMHILLGNIADGGQLRPLKTPIGPLMQSAQCHIGNGTLLFMTRQGLAAMEPGCGSEPVLVSQNQIPSDLKGIDPGAGDWCSLGYCSRWDAVDIIVNKASGTDLYYRYFLSDGGSFWPMDFGGTTMQLAANIKYKTSSTTSPLLLLNSAGLIYQYDTGASETIDSHLVYAPVAIGGPRSKATITEFAGTLAETSGAVTPTIYVGDSAQEAGVAAIAGSSPNFTCANMSAGLNGTENPLVNGTAACLRLDDVSGAAWSPEEFVLTISGDGARKKG